MAEKKAISDLIYEKIYNQIVSGKLSPGQRITELQIAQTQGVSQAPVREALKRLAEDRLVNLVPRSGCYVCKITKEDADYLFEIRKRLEVLALELAFEKFDMDMITELCDKMKGCLKLQEKTLVKRALKFDDQFHSMICEASGSVDLTIMVGKLRARIQMLRIRAARDPLRAKEALKRHIQILEAIISRKRREAIKLLTCHIDETGLSVQESFDE